MMKARIETSQEPRAAKSKTDLEQAKAMDLEANPEEIQPELENQEVLKEEVEMMGALESRYWDWRLAVGRYRRPNKWTQGDGGSRKKLPATLFLHRARDTVIRDQARLMLHAKLLQDRCSRRDIKHNPTAKTAYRTEA